MNFTSAGPAKLKSGDLHFAGVCICQAGRERGLHCLQAFGLPNTSLVTSTLHNSTNSFMPQGNLTQLQAGDKTPSPVLAATTAPLQPSVSSQAHRFPLDAAGYVEVSSLLLPSCLLCSPPATPAPAPSFPAGYAQPS